MKNGDIQCTGFVNVFASFSRRFYHGRLILSPLVVVESGQSRCDSVPGKANELSGDISVIRRAFGNIATTSFATTLRS
jgi:hypothetical protein